MGFMGFVSGGRCEFFFHIVVVGFVAEVVVVGWDVFGLAVVAVSYVGNLVGGGFYVWL